MTTIQNFEQALQAVANNPYGLKDLDVQVKRAAEGDPYAKLIIVAHALNEGWQPNWADDSRKYEPWFWMNDENTPGGFSYDNCDFWTSDSGVGSRLCFKSAELARYAGTQFVDLYREAYTVPQ